MRMGGSEPGPDRRGCSAANAARARNSGSKPRLNSARPPDLTNTRREIAMVSLSWRRGGTSRTAPSLPSLFLKLGAPEREAHGERPRPGRVPHVAQLFANHPLGAVPHRSAEDFPAPRPNQPLRLSGPG